MNWRELNEQLDGLLEKEGWTLNIVLPAVQAAAATAAIVAIQRGSFFLFWAFVVGTLISILGIFWAVRRQIAYSDAKLNNPSDHSASARYIRNRAVGRLVMPVVAWIFSFVSWALLAL